MTDKAKRKREAKPLSACETHAADAVFEQIFALLVSQHGKMHIVEDGDSACACGRKEHVLDACVSLILSQNTSGHNSKRALHLLRSHYPEGYAAILDKPVDTLEEVLRPVGLSHVKSRRIYRMLTEIRERTSGLDLDFLRDLPASDARTWLARLHGLGSKSVGCIMAFTLGHAELPVDTHVWRVSRRLSVGGLIRPEASRERVYEALRDAVPDVLKRELHMLLVRHGMQVCKPRAPRCDACALRPQCAAAAAAAAGNAGAEHKHSEEKSACKRSRAHEFEW